MSGKNKLTDAETVGRVRSAVRLAIAKQEAMGIAVARYDPKEEHFYIEEADGSRRIVKDNVKRVRYKERAAKGK